MDAAQRSPDLVRCTACWAIYAPGLIHAPGCPQCAAPGWVRTSIPNGEKPLRAPLEPRP